MEELVVALLAGLPLPIVIIVVLLFYPEKIEKWSALLWRLCDRCGGAFRFAHKKYVKHDLQGRVNGFVKSIKKVLPEVGDEKLSVEWVDPGKDRDSFIADGKVVLRLRRDDPQDHNFVHGAYYYVSGMLLRKAKRYISSNQREAIDLFVCLKLFEKEKPSVVSYFLDEYVHPKTLNKQKIRDLLLQYQKLEDSKYYFPIFIQELQFLGDKVFGQLKKASVESDVTALTNFLDRLIERQVGDEIDLNFEGNYCKVAVVIVGKRMNIAKGSLTPYANYITSLTAKGIESIYMLAPDYNKGFCRDLCRQVSESFYVVKAEEFVGLLKINGDYQRSKQFLCVLRNTNASPIQKAE